jgi:tetratricopeptide (TPR) repeat protein
MSRYGIDWDKGLENFTPEDYDKIFLETCKIIEAKSPDELLPGAFYDRSIIYENRHNYDAAISDLATAIKMNVPHLSAAHYNRGLAFYSKGQYENALLDFRKAITLDPDDEDTKEMIKDTECMLNLK